jgi:Protein of unknown function (DUF1353)
MAEGSGDSKSTTQPGDGWHEWSGVKGYSGFLVHEPRGRVQMSQNGPKNFAVSTSFAFVDRPTLRRLQARLENLDHSSEEAARMLNEARTLQAVDVDTDLASVPQFMAWFELPYGCHTLAAILHDNLIQDKPNTGPLGSDTLSDSFFRDMMGVAGVPFFKRWLMWAAVASRTRWAARGLRLVSLVVWGAFAVLGLSLGVLALAAAVGDLGGWDRPGLALTGAVVLPFLAGFLWGRQYGAALVAAAAGLWLVPAAFFTMIGLGFYWLSETLSRLLLPSAKRPDPAAILPPSLPAR